MTSKFDDAPTCWQITKGVPEKTWSTSPFLFIEVQSPLVKVENVGDSGIPYTYVIALFRDEQAEKERDEAILAKEAAERDNAELKRKLSEVEAERDGLLSTMRKVRRLTSEVEATAGSA
jgi:hypothetical protein